MIRTHDSSLDRIPATWRKSSYSGGQDECVEIADGFRTRVCVRDSKRPAGPVLTFPVDAWRVFVRDVGGR
ncbi:DUF397 domain-containing protein [Streptomyces sp. MST-110588]|uniref:DUF397 domain-containing protein n=1 Tax=Streptomyces sp. MST-110588 TaxID=2833628 RepID=UPI001F5C167E|nr:DUF397 domain-containing protein [Streptomyces sp. MST-110588]UNO44154.1 DUF397 domain-containing protein [Streptomyces sp. MST-110588]